MVINPPQIETNLIETYDHSLNFFTDLAKICKLQKFIKIRFKLKREKIKSSKIHSNLKNANLQEILIDFSNENGSGVDEMFRDSIATGKKKGVEFIHNVWLKVCL